MTLHTLRTASRIFHTPCTFRVYDDEGRVLVEVVDVHGRSTHVQATGDTYDEAVELIAHKLSKYAQPVVCPTPEALIAALERSNQLLTSKAFR